MAAADRQEDPTSIEPADLDGTLSAIVTEPKPRVPKGIPTHLSLPRQVMALATWPLIEQLLSFIVGFVDTALAGHMGEKANEAVSAVGAASYVVWLMGLIQASLAVGATALISRAVGGRHKREANAALGQSMNLAVICGLIIGVGCFVTAPMFAAISGLSGDRHALCTQYLQVMAAAAPFMTMLFVGAASLRGAGDFRSASLVMLLVNIVNAAMTMTFVWVVGWGVAGIAAGTAVAWVVGCAVMLGLLVRGRGGVRLHIHRLRFDPAMFRRIIVIGLPSLAENAAVWLGNFGVLWVVGHTGQEDLIGAHLIAIRLEAFSFLPGSAFGLAAATMVGQYLGAHQRQMARRAAWTCWGFGASFMSTMGLLFILFPQTIVRLMTDHPELVKPAAEALHVAGFMQLGFATSLILAGALRGAGDTLTTMLIMLMATYLVRLPLAYFIGITLGAGLWGVWIALTTEQLLRGGIFLARFLHGGWMKIKV